MSANALQREALRLAGRNGDLIQRAAVYHHLYQHSAGNHVFPLLAAHGALWAGGYFRRGMMGGAVLRWRYASAAYRRELMDRLRAFAEAFRDINRRVCVETYRIYYLTRDARRAEDAAREIPPALLGAMHLCHDAQRRGRALSTPEKRRLFAAFFHWEQEQIVGPAVAKAFAGFDWPDVHRRARRPVIRFAYLHRADHLRFTDFASTEERIAMGLRAFDLADRTGWRAVETALGGYGTMPRDFLADPARFFRGLADHLREPVAGVVQA